MRDIGTRCSTAICRIAHAYRLAAVEHQGGQVLCQSIRHICVFHFVPLVFALDGYILIFIYHGVSSFHIGSDRIPPLASAGGGILEIVHTHSHSCSHTSSDAALAILVLGTIMIIRRMLIPFGGDEIVNRLTHFQNVGIF